MTTWSYTQSLTDMVRYLLPPLISARAFLSDEQPVKSADE